MVTPGSNPIEALRQVKLFRAFTDAELAALARMGTNASYEAHSNIIIEGELTWGLYLILSGTVSILKMNKLTGDLYDVCQLHEGNFFGEMSLIDDSPRSATVKALKEVSLFCISKDSFENFLRGSAEIRTKFYANCVKDLVDRLRELDENYVVSQYQLWKSAMNKKEAA